MPAALFPFKDWIASSTSSDETGSSSMGIYVHTSGKNTSVGWGLGWAAFHNVYKSQILKVNHRRGYCCRLNHSSHWISILILGHPWWPKGANVHESCQSRSALALWQLPVNWKPFHTSYLLILRRQNEHPSGCSREGMYQVCSAGRISMGQFRPWKWVFSHMSAWIPHFVRDLFLFGVWLHRKYQSCWEPALLLHGWLAVGNLAGLRSPDGLELFWILWFSPVGISSHSFSSVNELAVHFFSIYH